MEYKETFEINDGIYFFTTQGKIDTGSEMIYIKYEGIGFDEQSSFVSSIEKILHNN